jgi:hypothetical protein
MFRACLRVHLCMNMFGCGGWCAEPNPLWTSDDIVEDQSVPVPFHERPETHVRRTNCHTPHDTPHDTPHVANDTTSHSLNDLISWHLLSYTSPASQGQKEKSFPLHVTTCMYRECPWHVRVYDTSGSHTILLEAITAIDE